MIHIFYFTDCRFYYQSKDWNQQFTSCFRNTRKYCLAQVNESRRYCFYIGDIIPEFFFTILAVYHSGPNIHLMKYLLYLSISYPIKKTCSYIFYLLINYVMKYSPVNNPKDYLPLHCHSPETRYYIAEFLVLVIHWRKHGNGHSKFSGFFLC